MLKKFFINFLFIIFLFSSINSIFAKYEVEPKIEKIVSNFIKKIDAKYDDKKEIIYLEKINSKINSILERKNINSKKQKLLNDILVLFNEEIFKKEYSLSLENNSQKFIEAKIINNLKNKLDNILIPNYLKNTGRKIYKIDENLEFIENNEIKKVDFTRYFIVKESIIKQLKNKKGIFAIDNNSKIYFIEKYKILPKIKYSESKKYFKNYINYKTNFFKKGNNFYSYNFKNYKFFDDKYGFYENTLKLNNIDKNNTILYFNKNLKYNFITNYTETKLINSDIIYGVVYKKDFLDDLVNDKLYLTSDTDYLFIDLKNKIKKLIKNKNKEEKIKIIYNFILENLEYTKNLDINDKKIFSGILSYKNKNGVCEGYVKLASYAYKFAGIKDVKVIRGDVIDAKDFPKIGHAWLKIGEKYYDPTFDDPIGQIKAKTFSEYKYFGLPKDLLYANRFDYGTTPDFLKEKSLNYRINLVNKNLSKLADKYKNSYYKILDGVKFNKQNNIEIGENITIEQLKKIIPFYEVNEKTSGELYFYKNGIKKNITKLQYYEINNKNLGLVISQLDYKLDGLYLFKWKDKNGKISWRLGFDVIIK